MDVHISLSIMKEGEWKRIVLLGIQDITHRKNIEETLRWQADHDAMTGLFNRRKFLQELDLLVEEWQKGGLPLLLFYMDLDQFKLVNDTAGHIAGDELLKDLSSLLKKTLPDQGVILARLGGDEFGLILKGANLPEGMVVAERIRKEVEAFRFSREEQSFQIGISIGMVLLDDRTLSGPQLLSISDMACIAAKEDGRNRIRIFRGNMDSYRRHSKQFEWITRIKKAIQSQSLLLYSQPILPLQAGNNRGHSEILLRMRSDRDDSILLPGHFLPAASRFEAMRDIDRYVIERTVEALARRPEMEKDSFFINISGESINDSTTPGFILDCLHDSGLKPGTLGFEVTESSAINNLQTTGDFMQELKHMGIRFALDDFGTGLSSFSYLKSLPLDLIKIDGSFVENITADPVDRMMVESIKKIGHMMRMEIVAEYVKSKEILDQIRELGVDYGQGFYLGEPAPLEPEVAR